MHMFIRAQQHTQTRRGGIVHIAGFTLIELLVSVSIFAIVMLVAVGTLIVLINGGATAQASQAITSNLSFALDGISRTLRTGYDYYCTGSVSGSLPGGTRDCSNGDSIIVFTNGETGDRMAYRYNEGELSIEQRVEDGAWIDLTSSDLAVESLVFVVDYTDSLDNRQPNVRVLMHGISTDEALQVRPEYFIQTSVTSRLLDV